MGIGAGRGPPERLFEEVLRRKCASGLDRKDEVVFHPAEPKLHSPRTNAPRSQASVGSAPRVAEVYTASGHLIGPTALADALAAERAVARARGGGTQRSAQIFNIEHVHRALCLEVLGFLALRSP
jgi:hypothetical protein